VSDRLLALLTSKLIDRCGGLAEASNACEEKARHYSAPQLSRCQTVGSGCYLPLDILAALETYCGEPVVSRGLARRAKAAPETGNLADLVCTFNEQAGDVQRHVRAALADGHMSPNEIKRGFDQIRQAREALDRTEAALIIASEAG
tara:strand:+ start:8211 stop:8648 length:438 start_codon:yes stop_codon:yes gene_type:complete